MIRIHSQTPSVRVRLTLLAAAALLLSGCRLDDFLIDNRWAWVWAVTPLLAIAILGGAVAHTRRRRDLMQHDLAVQRDSPSVKPILVWLVGTAVTALVAFAVYNILIIKFLEISQLAINIGAWLVGSIIGVAAAFFVGLKLAEP